MAEILKVYLSDEEAAWVRGQGKAYLRSLVQREMSGVVQETIFTGNERVGYLCPLCNTMLPKKGTPHACHPGRP